MSADRGMHLSRHIEELSGIVTANIGSFTFPLAQDLPRLGHTDGLLFIFAEGLDLLRRSFCAFCHQTLILAGTAWGTGLLEQQSSWLVPGTMLTPWGSQQH